MAGMRSGLYETRQKTWKNHKVTSALFLFTVVEEEFRTSTGVKVTHCTNASTSPALEMLLKEKFVSIFRNMYFIFQKCQTRKKKSSMNA